MASGTEKEFGRQEHRAPELEIVETMSRIRELDEVGVRIEGSCNLLIKADAAIRRGEAGDRDRALSLLDRAGRCLPAEEEIAENHRGTLTEVREGIAMARRQAEDLPD
ncbi:MAG: hypothetical protein QG622_1556 [Actinomycetota bacterium]|nr:hypothetical protein [Actinomycetota bacterium]